MFFDAYCEMFPMNLDFFSENRLSYERNFEFEFPNLYNNFYRKNTLLNEKDLRNAIFCSQNIPKLTKNALSYILYLLFNIVKND